MFLFFWVCFILGLCFAILAILCQNTVYSILVLILLFITAAALLFLLNVEFLGFIFIIVYVGAIAVLFLFVVMLLNIRVQEVHTSVMRYWPWGGLFGFSCLALLLVIFSFDLPSVFYITSDSVPSLSSIVSKLGAGVFVLFKGIAFAIVDFINSLSVASNHKLFYSSFVQDLWVFVWVFFFNTCFLQGFWFACCSLWLVVREAIVVQELHSMPLAWFGTTPEQLSYPVFGLVCVRDFFVSFYSVSFVYCVSFFGYHPSAGYLAPEFVQSLLRAVVASLPWCDPLLSVTPRSLAINKIMVVEIFKLNTKVSLLPISLRSDVQLQTHFAAGEFFKQSWLSYAFEVELLTLLGRVLYEPFAAYFINAGLILFIALIGALVLTYKQDTSRKRFYLLRQVNAETKRLLLRLPTKVTKGLLVQDSASKAF